MKLLFASLALGAAALGGGDKKPVPAVESVLSGDYLEARTCDVWTGACIANSETQEAGRHATVCWHFTKGAWSGVDLADRSAVLIIEAKATLGDKYHSPLPVRDVLLLDQRASDDQLVAMRAFVHAQMGDLAGNIIEERLEPIDVKIGCCDKKGCAKLVAGDVAKITTRCMATTDSICGHEDTFYPPLVELKDSMPAHTVENGVTGTLLGRDWTDRDVRSAFLGHFEVRSPAPALHVNPDDVSAH